MPAHRPPCIAWLTLPAALACGGSRPSRIVAGVDDTVVINSTRTATIPVDAFDKAGRPVRAIQPAFEQLSGDPIRISGRGTVHCTKSGDARVRATIGTVSTTFMLYCRPMRAFQFGNHSYGLFVGGPRQALEVVGVGLDGRPVTLIAARLRVRDSSIVGVEHGILTARQPGMTTIDVDAGDSRTSYFVQVLQLAHNSSALQPNEAFVEHVALAGGDMHSWGIARGRYEVRFMPDDSVHGSVLLAARNANCARYSDGEAHLSCVVRDDATVFMAIPRAAATRQPIAGRLVIRRMADSLIVNSYWFDTRAFASISTGAR